MKLLFLVVCITVICAGKLLLPEWFFAKHFWKKFLKILRKIQVNESFSVEMDEDLPKKPSILCVFRGISGVCQDLQAAALKCFCKTQWKAPEMVSIFGKVADFSVH